MTHVGDIESKTDLTTREVLRPLATVVIGGLVTSTVVTLFIIPTICSFFHREPTEA